MVRTRLTRSCCSQNLLGMICLVASPVRIFQLTIVASWSQAALATNAINFISSWFCIVTTFLAVTTWSLNEMCLTGIGKATSLIIARSLTFTTIFTFSIFFDDLIASANGWHATCSIPGDNFVIRTGKAVRLSFIYTAFDQTQVLMVIARHWITCLTIRVLLVEHWALLTKSTHCQDSVAAT